MEISGKSISSGRHGGADMMGVAIEG